jgi:CHAT domain-containing protein/tetratricopeptide (TPR) repeat protein
VGLANAAEGQAQQPAAEGRALLAAGRIADAESWAERQLADLEERQAADSIEAADVGDVLVEARLRGTKPPEAGFIDRARRVVATRETILGPEHPSVATSLENLARLLLATPDHQAARAAAERSLAIRQRALGPEHPDVASSAVAVAKACLRAGEYDQWLAFLRRALAIRESALGPNALPVAQSLNEIAAAQIDLGDPGAARPLLDRALAIRRAALAPDDPAIARTMGNLARVYQDLGNYTEARRLFEGTIPIFEQGGSRDDIGKSLLNLAVLCRQIGDDAGVRNYAERALAVWETAFGPQYPSLGVALDQLGALAERQGDLAEARQYYERSLRIREAYFGPESIGAAWPLRGMARLLERGGDLAGARGLYLRALAIWDKRPLSKHVSLIENLESLGALALLAGDATEAEARFGRALALREEAVGAAHHTVATALVGLAETRRRLADPSGALSLALRGEALSREHLRLTNRGLSERQALDYARTRPTGLDVALTLSSDGLGAEDRRSVWDAVIRARALVLDEMGARNRSQADSGDPDTTKLADELGSLRQRLANLLVRGSADDPAMRKLIEDVRVQREAAERSLAQRSASFRASLAEQQHGFPEVAAALPPGTVLVAYRRHLRRAAAGVHPPGDGVPSYLAFVLSAPESPPVVVPLGVASEIDRLVRQWRGEIDAAAGAGEGSRGAEARYRTAGVALREKVWDPVIPHVGRATQVFIVPDGMLNVLNFATLPVGRSQYLAQAGPRVHYLSAERDLARPARRPAKGGALLAVGGAAFEERSLFTRLTPRDSIAATASSSSPSDQKPFRGPRSSCASFLASAFSPLPASTAEARTVASLWTRSRRKGETGAATVLLGADANEPAVKERAGAAGVLHLATHAFLLGENCSSESNPLVLSGLALAGANHRNDALPEEDDGILTAEEVAALDLSDVDWAVLSGCDTGGGEVRAGEGVLGLRRAFQTAGAATLVMSLWPVEDESARHWMEALYRNRLVGRLSTVEAVRRASLAVLEARGRRGESTHPYFWGAFVATGDWR